LVISNEDTISDTSIGMAKVSKDDNMKFSINICCIDVVSLFITSFLSHLRLWGLFVRGDNTIVEAIKWANVLHAISLAFSNNGAANTREDKEGEKVIKDS